VAKPSTTLKSLFATPPHPINPPYHFTLLLLLAEKSNVGNLLVVVLLTRNRRRATWRQLFGQRENVQRAYKLAETEVCQLLAALSIFSPMKRQAKFWHQKMFSN